MTQGWTRSRNIGVWCAVAAIVLALAVCGVLPASADEGTGNMVFFKGGFVAMNSSRSGEVFTDAQNATGAGTNDGRNGWYAGAGLDLVMSKDVWGGMDKTWVLGEIGLQFNRLNSNRVLSTTSALDLVTPGEGGLDGGAHARKVQLTMMTINVSPKIKFMEGSAFRPWVIPIGIDFHVISPPSNQSQYLDLGVQFGAGFEYAVWKAFKAGMDARYHLTANMTNTTNSYFQVGPYVGITF